MDNLVFEESLNTEVEHSEFISKKWIYVNDNNNGNYTSQVVLDSTPLSNSGGWVHWQEGFILMPLVVQLTSGTAGSLASGTNKADYSWAIKNGFHQMINSATIEFNNQNIVQQTPFTNVFRSFKLMTSFSDEDVKNHGASIGFYPDNAGSWSYLQNANLNTATVSDLQGRGTASGTSATASGIGIANNQNSPAVLQQTGIAPSTTYATNAKVFSYPASPVAGVATVSTTSVAYDGASNPSPIGSGKYAFNNGMYQRQLNYGFSASPETGDTNTLNQNLVCGDITSMNTIYRNSKVSLADGNIVWYIYAKLRLKDLTDFFEKVPLLKGSTFRFLINTNQAIVNFQTVAPVLTATTTTTGGLAVSDSAKLKIVSVNVVGGLTNPLMIASNQIGQGCSPLSADTYNLSISIFKNQFTAQTGTYTAGQSSLTACRLYAPVYTMSPLAESKYLSLAPTKRILYKDIFQYQFNTITAGDSFNFLVSNGINRIRSVLVVPFVAKSQADNATYSTTATTLPFDSYLSPCNTAPATPDPIPLTNFNILISGVQLFLSNELYDFEAFREQLMSSNQLNGNSTTGLTSGLISEDDFSRGMRYYYGDCSRSLPSEENVSRAVQIVGQNASKVAINIMVFVEFMKEITIDLTTGARID